MRAINDTEAVYVIVLASSTEIPEAIKCQILTRLRNSAILPIAKILAYGPDETTSAELISLTNEIRAWALQRDKTFPEIALKTLQIMGQKDHY